MAITHLAGAARDGFATVMPGKLWRFDGTFGVTRCSAGWPGTPGMFTDATIPNVRGFLDGKEVPIAVQALRGKHPDGSYRAIGVQVNAVASTLKRAFRLEIWSTARSVGNTLTWIEPTYGLPGGESATDWPAVSYNAVVACTDAEHLCNSYVALTPLQPAADDSATSDAVFGITGELGEWSDYVVGLGVAPSYVSTYEHVAGFYQTYCRTANLTYYEHGHKWMVSQVSASLYNPGSVESDSHPVMVDYDATLPEPDAGSGGLPAEQNTVVYIGWAMGYLISGWEHPRRQLAHKVQRWAGATVPFSDIYSPRFNMYKESMVLPVAYAVEASLQVPGGYGAGRNPSTRTFADQLPTILTECETWEWSGYGTGRFDGLVGLKQTATDDFPAAGRFPLFQNSITARVLIFYYNNVAPDSRIPVWLKTLADVTIQQGTLAANQATWPYSLEDVASPTPDTPSYYGGFYAELFGFMYSYETDPTDKATYLTWLNACMNPAIYTSFGNPTGKAFGEWFGGNMQSGAYYRDGGAVRGITGAHPTTITEPPIWTEA